MEAPPSGDFPEIGYPTFDNGARHWQTCWGMIDDTAALSFEDAMRELESIVRDLETGKAKLDDAVRAYERGAALKAHCEAKLAGAKGKIEQITVGPDGKISTAPLDPEKSP
jgi:exodeoxyribonuclease VII small subunit